MSKDEILQPVAFSDALKLFNRCGELGLKVGQKDADAEIFAGCIEIWPACYERNTDTDSAVVVLGPSVDKALEFVNNLQVARDWSATGYQLSPVQES